MTLPKKVSLVWVDKIRNTRFSFVLFIGVLGYIAIAATFALLYYLSNSIQGDGWIDYMYFSLITSLTIGYGDFSPLNGTGQLLVIVHALLTFIYSALMTSFLVTKLLFSKDAVVFSRNVIYCEDNQYMSIRIINTNTSPIINPEIRVSVTEHQIGNVIAGKCSMPLDFTLDYLGKHDFVVSFLSVTPEGFDAWKEVQKAKAYEKLHSGGSRFRITITITGSTGIQSVACLKKYYVNDIIEGKAFKPIQYTSEDQNKRGMRYKKIEHFWEDFNSIIS